MKNLLWQLFSGLIPLSMLFLALYIFDPYQFYHKPYFRNDIFDSNMHYQNAGIINNYDFDSIILGSSLMVNTSSNEASQKLGNHWVNLSISGGVINERLDILNYAMSRKDIKDVIFSIEPGWISDNKRENKFLYLYDGNPFNDFKTYLNEKFFFCLFIQKSCIRGKHKLDRPASIFDSIAFTSRLGGIQSWIKNSNHPEINTILKKIVSFQNTTLKTNNQKLSEYLIDTLQKYQNTNFYLVIPPISRLSNKLEYDQNFYPIVKKILSYHLKNIKIYGFDNTNIPDDISRYVDLVHYDEKINSFMLDAIKNDTHRITLENVDSYFEEMKKKVEAYDIEPLRKQIIESGVLSH
ncbi:hypothetical protein [Helicobacter brantae]|uniref:Uncharacterized protein n=1 Tax=Helicobacter brantae TaxID=375927 RepID=A0A3D8J5E6_9HELI|nr:hypothetical protein [Helicobacter brantae]RDU72124.1 hypothetical protein CQA58_00530 [Helicobacter brantae]